MAEEEAATENPEPAPAAPMLSEGFQEGAELELDTVYEIPVEISVVLGCTTMPISNLLKMGPGAIIELERKVGDAVDVYVNDRLVARGEVVIVDDNVGITMTEIIKADKET